MKIKFFENDQERWNALSKLRYDVAEYIKIKPNSKILDVLVGYADFTRAIAKTYNMKVTAIELMDVDIEKAMEKTKKEHLEDKVEMIKMDATDMKFKNNTFDYVVNFIGWEDLTAISGLKGVEKVFSEMVRVLKKGGILVITFIPEIRPINKISKFDKNLDDFMWLSKMRRMFFSESFFEKMFKKYNIKINKKKMFKTTKTRTKPDNAKGVIKWLYDNYESFYSPETKMRHYKEIIKKYEKDIDKYGTLEDASKVIVLVGQKK